MNRRGLALILVVGVLGVLAVLGSAFAVLSRLERKAAALRVQATQALLLARSGVEDAVARIALGQDPTYAGEDWNANGVLDAGEDVSPASPGVLDRLCPLRFAQRPSYFVRNVASGGYPALVASRGRSGGFDETRTWALKVEDLNGRIFVNGGSGNDVTMSGPNGFLVRLLDNLDLVVTGTSGLGTEVVSARPALGYERVEDLKGVLSAARYAQFKNLLTADAWVDATVVKPQPMDARPNRWLDVDDAHKNGSYPTEVAGVKVDPATITYAAAGPAPGFTAPRLTLNPGITGDGKEGNPWTVTISTANRYEGPVTYPVKWERNFVYAARQLRLAPPEWEPRAPVSLNAASEAVLASVFTGLKGTWLETWEAASGWDDGFSWHSLTGNAQWPQQTWSYPSDAAEDTPWVRTRLDYGMSYGSASRPWYGPASYDPGLTNTSGFGGRPVVQCAPLGRLKETRAISVAQAKAIAGEIRRHGRFGTWMAFNAFVDALPLWEDRDDDGVLDGPPARTEREDQDGNGVMTRKIFTVASGAWSTADVAWVDRESTALGAGEVPGLTLEQKDVLKAMANPNTDLNDFNPDQNLHKRLDKTDLAGVADGFFHTTELALDSPGPFRLSSLGRSAGGAQALSGGRLSLSMKRDTTQADFLWAPASTVFSLTASLPYVLSGLQPLVSYPEPQSLAPAAYDGQVSLGFIGTPSTPGEALRADLFDTLDSESGDIHTPDVRGPFRLPLVGSAGAEVGNLFPDGVYAEKDASIKFPLSDVLPGIPPGTWPGAKYHFGCWIKPNWAPDASPRIHALFSLSHSPSTPSGMAWTITPGWAPVDDIWNLPIGIFFLPNRNAMIGPAGVNTPHSYGALGQFWPRRSLVFGSLHGLYVSETLHYGGIESSAAQPSPVGRLEAHRWTFLSGIRYVNTLLNLGRQGADAKGGPGGSWLLAPYYGAVSHRDGTPNHIRFGEVADLSCMNYVADATYANLMAAHTTSVPTSLNSVLMPRAKDGRYLKEGGARFRSAPLDASLRPLRATWTEVPCDLWFDEYDGVFNGGPGRDAWMDAKRNDRFGPGGSAGANGLRDVRIDLEVYDDRGLLAVFSDPAGPNFIPGAVGRVYYKAVFVNEWDTTTRSNEPLDVTPFLDDVTFLGHASFLAWDREEDE